MKPPVFMVIAGEASGDMLAAELVTALRRQYVDRTQNAGEGRETPTATLEPRFIGAGGPRMSAAGVRLEVDMTAHAIIGLAEALKKLLEFRRLFHRLLRLAREHTPDTLVCVDFSGFNRRFAHAVRQRARRGVFLNWRPRIVQFVSPQVWASRPGRARLMARDFDLLLSIFPFEREWYARRAPELRVEYVGHPLVDRHQGAPIPVLGDSSVPRVVLLPGSRAGELRRHLPVVLGAAEFLRREKPATRFTMVLPDDDLAAQARAAGLPEFVTVRVGGLPEALCAADLAIASTGTVTMECAWFRVPTVALYKTSWSTYQIGKRIITVKHLAMPNLLLNSEVFPEFVQHEAEPERVGRAALAILNDPPRQAAIRASLNGLAHSLGPPGAVQRAARAILSL